MFGTGTTRPVPDVDRTEHLLMLGANPLASNGSLMTAPDMRGPAARAARPRRQARRDRPAPHRDRRGGRRAPLHPPRHRRPAAVRDGPRPVRGGARADPASGSRARPTGLDEVARARRAVHARGRRARRAGSTPETIRRLARELAAAPRAAVYGRIGTCTAGVRDAGQLAGRRAQRADRQPRPRGRRDVPARRRRTLQRRRRARRGRGARFGRCRAASAGCDEVFGELPVACLAEEIETPGRGSGPGADHDRRQPGRLDAQQRAPRRARSASSTSWSPSTSTSTRPRATPT